MIQRVCLTIGVAAAVILTLPVGTLSQAQAPAFDLVVRGGRVVDGTGSPWFVADVGIKGDTIVAVAPRLEAGNAQVIEAQGLVVSPGFIDVHSHSEARADGQDIIGNPGAENNVRQGVTTVFASPDGGGSVRVAIPRSFRGRRTGEPLGRANRGTPVGG